MSYPAFLNRISYILFKFFHVQMEKLSKKGGPKAAIFL